MALYDASGHFQGVTQQKGSLYDASGNFRGTKSPVEVKKQNIIPRIGQGVMDLGGKIADIATTSEQGLAKNISSAFGAQQYSPEEAAQNAKTIGALITHAHQMPVGDARRKQLLELAKNIAEGGQGQAQQNTESLPSNLDVGLNVAGTAADVLTAGTYGSATKGMKAGELALKEPTIVTGAKIAGKEITNTVDKVAQHIAEESAKKTVAKDAEKIAEQVAPKLNVAKTAEAIKSQGTTKTGIFRKIKLVASPYTQKVVDTIQKFVPDFKPKGNLTENIPVVKDAVYKMASDLKQKVVESGKDIIYPFQELEKKMNAIPRDISIKAEPTLSRYFELAKKAALDLAKETGGTVSGLFDARKAFDQVVEKEIPNLYDKAYSPLRTAITGIRNAMTDFTAQHLPSELGFKESLQHQSRLFSAIDNMAEKAAAGAEKEVGTNVLDRTIALVKKHPLASTLGAGWALSEIRKYLPFLP